MSTQIIPFTFEGKDVRVVLVDQEPWWIGKDVAERLGYANPSKAMTDHCRGITKRYPLSTNGGIQELRIINEPDVLRLIIGSKLPAAQTFEQWVFEEVLPSIRKTGAYAQQGASAIDPYQLATLGKIVSELNATIADANSTIKHIDSEKAILRRENRLLRQVQKLESDLARKNTRITSEEIYTIRSMKRSGARVSFISEVMGRSDSAVRRILGGRHD